MVELVTREAIESHTAALIDGDCITPELGQELLRLLAESDRLSNWTDASRHLPAAGYNRIRAAGPVSKVLRALAFLLERLRDDVGDLRGRELRISRVSLKDTYSGCSDFGGRIAVEATEPEGAEIVLFEGSFVWDCAAHGLAQSSAAQQLGYRCMVSFPDIGAGMHV